MSTLTLRTETVFSVVTCYKCAVPFCMTQEMDAERRSSHESFWCPNGHSQIYSAKSEVEKARDEIARQKQLRDQADAAAAQARAERDAAEKKAHRLKQRIKGGACPCCKRSFIALARHMATKHPGYAKPA